ncbi:unnamed protein product [Allacma fusca]|uniref:Uncharacterized protein n=1 Tax=Allacma fusca TaxID=39272 RepID=A0A8J2LJJ5_9HEXA|nr:unnamed protein product [Allacma fusca]
MAEEDRLQEKRMSVHVYYRYQPLNDLEPRRRLQGPLRLAVFCSVTVLLPCLMLIAPLYIRYSIFRDYVYTLVESDLIIADRPISTFWCEGQALTTNSSNSFQAFILDKQQQNIFKKGPVTSEKNIRVSSESLEYFGVFLPEGSTVTLSTCSASHGAKLTILQGLYSLRNCGLPVDTDWMSSFNVAEGSNENYRDSGNKVHMINQIIKLRTRFNRTRLQTQENFGDTQLFQGSNATISSNISIEDTNSPVNLHDDNRTTAFVDVRSRKVALKSHAKRTTPAERNNIQGTFLREDIKTLLNWTCSIDDILRSLQIISTHNCLHQDLTTIPHNSIVQQITVSDFYYFVFHRDDGHVVNNMLRVHLEINPIFRKLENASSGCNDTTECSVPLDFLTSGRVLVKVPMSEDIKDRDDLQSMTLVSSCIPRLGVYFIFPVSILVLVLCCAFV